MKLLMTLMVRDEIDIIAPMLEHHLAQGVDLIIATDNGSVDGTTQVLEAYAATGRVELHHDPQHRKQQGEVVTRMARRARTEHGARRGPTRHDKTWCSGWPSRRAFPSRAETSGSTSPACSASSPHFYKEDLQLHLHELARILRPGGTVVATWLLSDEKRLPQPSPPRRTRCCIDSTR